MSLEQRLAWTDGASTLAGLGAASALWLSETPLDARQRFLLAASALLVTLFSERSSAHSPSGRHLGGTHGSALIRFYNLCHRSPRFGRWILFEFVRSGKREG